MGSAAFSEACRSPSAHRRAGGPQGVLPLAPVLLLEARLQQPQHRPRVPHQGQVGPAVPVHLGRVDVHPDDLGGCQRRPVVEDPVEPDAHRHHHVGHARGGEDAHQPAVPEGEGVLVGDGAPPVVQQQGRDAGLLHQGLELVRAAAVGDAAPPDQQRPLGGVEQLGRLPQGVLLRHHRVLLRRPGRERHRSLVQLVVERLRGELQEDGAGPAGDGLAEGDLQVLRYPRGVVAPARPLHHRLDHAHLVDVLQGAPVQFLQGGHAAQDHQGYVLGGRVDHPGEGVGEAGTRGDQAHPGLAGVDGPGVGHHRRGLLVPHVDQPQALVQAPVEDGRDVPSRKREDRVDALHVLEILGDQPAPVQFTHYIHLP